MAAAKNWCMYHGDYHHSGNGGEGSSITAAALRAGDRGPFGLLHSIQVPGSILSVPAVVDGFIYVGISNSMHAPGGNGGAILKFDIHSPDEPTAVFQWETAVGEGDTHGFMGMGCTPAVCTERLFFSAFNGKFYCLESENLELQWVTDLRYADIDKNQPVSNVTPPGQDPTQPKAAGWSSPVVVGDRVFVGMGEGENPYLYGYVYCLNADSGQVEWIFCTSQFEEGKANQPNQIPEEQTAYPLRGYTMFRGEPVTRGCSIWSSIAYEADLDRLYMGTGNEVVSDGIFGLYGTLPTPGWSNGLLALDASSGEFCGFVQTPVEGNYRSSDVDVDIGAAPTIYSINDPDDPGKKLKVVAVAGKNGSMLLIDADTMELIRFRQMLPYYKDGSQIPTVDPHPADNQSLNPRPGNRISDRIPDENFHGSYSCPALYRDPDTGGLVLFCGIGGPNYHRNAPAIDTPTTPFMRALDAVTLEDVWETAEFQLDPTRLNLPDPYVPVRPGSKPPPGIVIERYIKASRVMYRYPRECALSSPAVINDVVFCTTSEIAIHAFAARDGEVLYSNLIGSESGGMNGGYGYCMGPAVYGDIVVAGALVQGNKAGGLLNIYGFGASSD